MVGDRPWQLSVMVRKRHYPGDVGFHFLNFGIDVGIVFRARASGNWNKIAASRENLSSGFPTRCDTNRAVQQQKIARGLKFHIYEVEGLYYLCSENKGADQLHGYRLSTDLRLCFRIFKKAGFLITRLDYWLIIALIRF